MAGIALGFKNDNYGAFNLENEDEVYEAHYYAALATIDLTLLKVCGGYAFGGRELYREDVIRNTGQGWFVTVEALYVW